MTQSESFLFHSLGLNIIEDPNCPESTIFFVAKRNCPKPLELETKSEWAQRCGAITDIGKPE